MGWKSLSQIDILGALLCAAATISLMLGLTWGSDRIYAWGSTQVVGMLAVGVALFVLFLLVERKASEPILPLDLFRNQIFSVGASLALLQSMIILGLSLYLPLFLQGVLAVSPTNAGLVMTPFSLSVVAGAMLSSVAMSKLKRYQIVAIAGALFMVVGTLLIMLMTPSTNLLQAILFMMVVGIGIGSFFSIPTLVVQNALPASRLGVVTASMRYLGQMGATLGIAIVGTVVTSAASGDLMSHMPSSPVAKLALSGALTQGFLAVLVFAGIALVATFFLKDMPLREAQGRVEEESVMEEEEEVVLELVHA